MLAIRPKGVVGSDSINLCSHDFVIGPGNALGLGSAYCCSYCHKKAKETLVVAKHTKKKKKKTCRWEDTHDKLRLLESVQHSFSDNQNTHRKWGDGQVTELAHADRNPTWRGFINFKNTKIT